MPGSGEASTVRMDRDNPRFAEEVAARLYPDAAVRTSRLSLLAQAIELAHREGEASWCLGLYPRRIKVNVGRCLLMSLRGDSIFVSLADKALSAEDRRTLSSSAERVHAFVAAPGVTGYVLSDADFVRLWPSVEPAFRGAIPLAVRSSRNSPYFRAHSSGALKFLRTLSGRPLPDPVYGKTSDKPRLEEFQALWDDFVDEFLLTEKGQQHLRTYAGQRAEGKRNFEAVAAQAQRGEDITEAVLLKLLPHSNTTGNRERGAWIFIAPAVTKDIKSWFEGAKWTKPEDWPRVTRAILKLVQESLGADESFRAACKEFSSQAYSKGFQSGILTPILSAVAPDRFLIMNNKSRRTLNRFAGLDYSSRLSEYPALNDAGHAFLTEIMPILESVELNGALHSDVFDQFCHWYVAIKGGFDKTPPTKPGEREDEVESSVENGPNDEGRAGDRPAYFSERSFDLMTGLMKDPTKKCYDKNRDALESQVIDPLKELMYAVIERLPAAMTERMEIEKHLFGKILKNDYGKGGAWPYFWGALYPKGGVRNRDAQLFLWINGDQIEAGFSFGDYDEESGERITKGLGSLDEAARREVQSRVLAERFVVGGRNSTLPAASLGGLDEYLKRAEEEGDYSIRLVLPRREVVAMPAGELEARVTDTFVTLFPVFELASRGAVTFPIDPGVIAEPRPPRIVPPIPTPTTQPPEAGEVTSEPPYSIDAFAAETGFDLEELQRWIRILDRKKQIVLQGPPGTGKTFLALRLARHLVGGTSGIHETVQFHPAYAYEDFMQGLRPEAGNGGMNFKLEEGRFLRFCSRARSVAPAPAVLIIDEINRANLALVFGELMLLLEYRDKEIPLAAGGAPFRIPENVFIIGTMNTADRSIARMDHALRRRFSFIRLRPDYEILKRHLDQRGLGSESLLSVLREMNGHIGDPNYEIGISYFLQPDGDLRGHLGDIWHCDIEPYLEEFFYDQPERVNSYRWEELVKDRLKDWA